MGIISAYERPLFSYLLAELKKISGIKVYGILNEDEFDERCPTVSFTRESHSPEDIATKLGEKGIFVWHGNYYARAVTERLWAE